jgi:hypothetical protein
MGTPSTWRSTVIGGPIGTAVAVGWPWVGAAASLAMVRSMLAGASLSGTPSLPATAKAKRCGLPATENAGDESNTAMSDEAFSVPPLPPPADAPVAAPVVVELLHPARAATPAIPAAPSRIERRLSRGATSRSAGSGAGMRGERNLRAVRSVGQPR